MTIPDNYDFFDAEDRAYGKWLHKRPICYHCGHHIQEDTMFDINGNYYHVDCAEEEFKKSTDDYLE